MKYTFKIFLAMAVISILISGCSVSDPRESNTDPSHSLQKSISQVPVDFSSEASSIPVQEPTESDTQPNLSLNAESGSFLLRYDDKTTEDYLDYYMFIPESPKINMPLVVFLHGDGQVNQPESLINYGMIAQARSIYGENFPFIAISPCTRITSWVSGSIPETLKGLIDHITETYSIDPDKIIIAGHSRGAIGVWNMASLYGDFFSAAVPISCGPDGCLDPNLCAQVPVLAFVGTVGQYEYNYNRSMSRAVQKINESGGMAQLIILDGEDHVGTCTAAFTDENFQWMLTQNKE